MKWGIGTVIAIVSVALIAVAWFESGGLKQHAIFSATTPEEAVQALMSEVQARNYQAAYAMLDPSSVTGCPFAAFSTTANWPVMVRLEKSPAARSGIAISMP